MANVRVLVIEDRPEESDVLIPSLESNGFEVAAIARDLKEAFERMHDTPFDIAIVDVYLGDTPDGIAFAESLNAQPNLSKPFVFLTSSKDRSIFDRAKLTKPFAFLLKPFNELELLYSLEMAVEKYYDDEDALESSENAAVMAEDHLFIKKKGALNKVWLKDIAYVEVDERYCTLYCDDTKYVVMKSLKQMEQLLSPHGFIRTHRKFLAQKAMIEQIILGEDTVILKGGHSIPISDSYKDITKTLNIL
ncbi:MAG: response regulator transcription factor [bacterium]|nr:response regulator transcription factor [bacterium]